MSKRSQSFERMFRDGPGVYDNGPDLDCAIATVVQYVAELAAELKRARVFLRDAGAQRQAGQGQLFGEDAGKEAA